MSELVLIFYYLLYSKFKSPMSNNDLMASSSPQMLQQTSKNQSQVQIEAKTVTKFPPILKNKVEEAPSVKQNIKEPSSTLSLIKKNSEPEPNYLLKRTNQQIKKKKQKNSAKFFEVKPEMLQKYKQYIEFTSLINLSNNLSIIQTQKFENYRIYVGKGNNSSVIKSLFRTYRPWWTVQQNPDSENINFYWFQLRQNAILDQFKDNMKGQADFQNCNFIAEDVEKVQESKVSINQSRSNQKRNQIRSQSVTQKDLRITTKFNMTKRSSSRQSKNGQRQERFSPMTQKIKKQVKEQIEIQNNKKKKALVNPKMWPIYNNYRKIFSPSEMKQLKKLKIIQEDSKIVGTLTRNKQRLIESRSNYLKMHNHLTNNWNLSNKKALFINLKFYYEALKMNPFEYIPMTFHVTQSNDKEFLKFTQQYQRRTQQIKEDEKTNKKNQAFKHGFRSKKRNAWLVKPGQNTNRGTGIEVVQSLEEIKEIINKETKDSQGRERTHIVQQYIVPFLYQKRKFDIRSYICMTSINGYQKGYWFQDGYIRTASKEFNMKNLNNKYIHLTNDAVQKYHQDYGKFEPANKLSFADFQRYLDTVYNSNNENKLKFFTQAYPEMKRIATDIMRSVYTKINPTKKQFSFEIFGLDYMIDQNFKVWLIQCNTNPCLELACPLLGRLIPSMLESAFRIAIDPIFPPPALEQILNKTKKVLIPQNMLENNKYELIFDEAEEGKQLKVLLSNMPEVQIYDIEEEEQEYDQNGEKTSQIVSKDNEKEIDSKKITQTSAKEI